MRLRRPCPHDRYDEHFQSSAFSGNRCPGADIAWRFNEAVSLLREARFRLLKGDQ